MNAPVEIERPPKGSIISIQTGKAKSYGENGAKVPNQRRWTSAIVKTPIDGQIYCGRLGLEGDEQADRKHHGGEDKAVLMYPHEHYALWREEYPNYNWRPGGFGENLTVLGMTEFTVCIGDTFRIGDVLLQACGPRQPCYKLARRWQFKQLPNIVMQNNRSGWYCRVLEAGTVEAGAEVEPVERHSSWTIADVAYIIRHVGDDFDRAERLYQCEELSGFLRNFLRKAIDENDPRKQKPAKRQKRFFFF